MKISDVIHHIEEQNLARFSYNPSRIPLDSIVFIPQKEIGFSDLEEIFLAEGVIISSRGNHLILKPGKIPESIVLSPSFYTISGYVRNEETRESMIGATVSVDGEEKGIISNGYGFYSLRLKEGNYQISSSFIGYGKVTFDINLDSDKDLDIELQQDKTEIEEVVIKNDIQGQAMQNMQLGRSEITVSGVKKIPGFMGESDVIKSLQSLPGIHFYSDGSTIFHVRGGARDQNLLLIDEAPVYNPAHMLGIFSVFSPDAINSINIYKGDMPAWYGGRLSSVIDIKTREGNAENYSLSGNTGLVATTLNFEAPLLNKKGSFYFSGRRSHLKWIADRDNPSIEQLHFSDLTLKANYRFNRKNRLYISFYNGLDRFRNRESRQLSTGISWTNFAGNIRWNHVFGDRLFSNTSIIASNYDYNLYTSYQLNQRWNTGISLFALKSDFSFYINPSSTLYYGILLGNHSYYPGNFYSGDDPNPLGVSVPNKFTLEKALYISHKYEFGDNVELRYGLRFGRWENRGSTTEFLYDDTDNVIDTIDYQDNETYNSFFFFEPRISMAFRLSRLLTGKIAFSRNTQHEFLITNSISPFTSLEVWLPAGPNIDPMLSQQITAGINFLDPTFPLSLNIEFFYKDIWNYISYKDHAYMLFNPHVETQFRTGTSKAYGIEFIIKKAGDRWNGWISYAWSRAMLKISEINKNNMYPARYDRPHSLSVFSEFNFTPGWNVSASWTYSTGAPFTTPTGYYQYLGYQVPYYEERNNDRLPDYHRLDISTSIRLNPVDSENEHYLKASIFNLYGRKNPFNINFNKMIDENGNIVVPADYKELPLLESTMMYLFGTVPSISYHFKF